MATFEFNSDTLNRASRTSAPERFEKEHGEKPANPTEVLGAAAPAESSCGCGNQAPDPRRLRQESIIALKVYDSCRQQDCLDEDELGPARAAESGCIRDKHYKEGEIIEPPHNAAAVSIDRLRIKKIIIVDKKHNPFKRGFWDIDLKYVFEYRLNFREADCDEIGSIKANSIFSKKVTLFGSVGSDIAISTDLFNERSDESPTLSMDPFVLVEAKPVALSAKLKYSRRPFAVEELSSAPNEVIVTIGLFTIIKLYRIVHLMVESRGFSIPSECEEQTPVNVCEYFERLAFPMDVFAPPQKPEFEAGVSGDISREEFFETQLAD